MICDDCGAIMTDEEIHYYAVRGHGRCETCEGEWHDRIKAWRLGGDDPEFDQLFAGEQPTVH